MTTRSICWGLLGACLVFGQALPALPEHGNQTLADRMGELSRKLNPGKPPEPDQKALHTFTGTFSRQPRPAQRKLIQPQPQVCAVPLLEGKPAGDPNQWTMRVVKPRKPLPRMPQLQPPAPACPSPNE